MYLLDSIKIVYACYQTFFFQYSVLERQQPFVVMHGATCILIRIYKRYLYTFMVSAN